LALSNINFYSRLLLPAVGRFQLLAFFLLYCLTNEEIVYVRSFHISEK